MEIVSTKTAKIHNIKLSASVRNGKTLQGKIVGAALDHPGKVNIICAALEINVTNFYTAVRFYCAKRCWIPKQSTGKHPLLSEEGRRNVVTKLEGILELKQGLSFQDATDIIWHEAMNENKYARACAEQFMLGPIKMFFDKLIQPPSAPFVSSFLTDYNLVLSTPSALTTAKYEETNGAVTITAPSKF